MSVRLVVVVDNEPSIARRDLLHGWGLSIYVELPDGFKIIFDTGHDEVTFRNNVQQLGIDLSQVSACVISHEHGDHTGGLGYVVEYCKNLVIYLPSPSRLASELVGLCRVELNPEQVKLRENVHIVNFKRSFIPEQSLIIDHPRGLIVITGCSHPGIEHIIRTCTGLFKKNILLLIGGFHLFHLTDRETERMADKLCRMQDLEKICPLHCSGTKFRKALETRCVQKYVPAATGSLIEITLEGEVKSRLVAT